MTSLPGPHFNGDIGKQAFKFVDFLEKAEQSWWQLLPINPVGKGNSPYSSISTFAGEELLIDLESLVSKGLLTKSDLACRGSKSEKKVNYRAARIFREKRLRLAYESAKKKRLLDGAEFEKFCGQNQFWLRDYVLFRALCGKFGTERWYEWPNPFKQRNEDALRDAERELSDEILFLKFTQFVFFSQWRLLKDACDQKGIGLIGDVPIFVAAESADVWAHQGIFCLGRDCKPSVVAGVPPDYFNSEGQLWGNALYDWTALRRAGYYWWIERLKHQLTLFDAVRMDHFIGFHRYWEIPAHAKSAKQGKWVPGPGEDFFNVAGASLGKLPLIAEDLGLVTREVLDLRDQFDLPGMRVIQFAFGEGGDYHLPYRYKRNAVAYTGTHDNFTSVQWYGDLVKRCSQKRSGKAPYTKKSAAKGEYETLVAYLGLTRNKNAKISAGEVCQRLVREVMASIASLAILPIQDVLGLGPSARMNEPGVAEGNWEWRLAPAWMSAATAQGLAELTRACGRSGKGS